MMGEDANKGYKEEFNEEKQTSKDDHEERKRRMLNKYAGGNMSIEDRIDRLEEKINALSDQVALFRHEMQETMKKLKNTGGNSNG